MAIAMASIVAPNSKDRKSQIVGWLLVCILLCHTLVIQKKMYDDGYCQSRALSYLDAQLKLRPPNMLDNGLIILADPDSPSHVVSRAVFGRQIIGPLKGLEIKVRQNSDNLNESDMSLLRFDKTCTLTRITK